MTSRADALRPFGLIDAPHLALETRHLGPNNDYVTLVHYTDGWAAQALEADPKVLRQIADALEPFDKWDSLRFHTEAELLEGRTGGH